MKLKHPSQTLVHKQVTSNDATASLGCFDETRRRKPRRHEGLVKIPRSDRNDVGKLSAAKTFLERLVHVGYLGRMGVSGSVQGQRLDPTDPV